jgi:hypothetical protein
VAAIRSILFFFNFDIACIRTSWRVDDVEDDQLPASLGGKTHPAHGVRPLGLLPLSIHSGKDFLNLLET